MKILDLIDKPRCKFTVAIEGPDRVGKATQARHLASRFERENRFRRVGIIETPIKDGTTHARIYEMLHDGRAKKFPATFQGIQVLNRILYQEVALKHWLMNYDAFVFDRWNASSYAYGRAAGLSHDELMCELDLVAEPDMTIVLDGDPFPKNDLDDYERDIRFQKKVRKAYIEWAELRPKGHQTYIVDANDDIDIIAETIWELVSDTLDVMFPPTKNVVNIVPYIQARHAVDFMRKNDDD